MPTGLTEGAGWQIGVSRTLPVPLEHVWEWLVGEGARTWLGGRVRLPTQVGEEVATAAGVGELRGFRPLDRVRLTWRPTGWDHETTVQVAVTGRSGKTTVRFHQERLADAEERERQRAHWRAVMDQVEAALVGPG
jgi:uncharacterized protein YndB with AHSA1/START domain